MGDPVDEAWVHSATWLTPELLAAVTDGAPRTIAWSDGDLPAAARVMPLGGARCLVTIAVPTGAAPAARGLVSTNGTDRQVLRSAGLARLTRTASQFAREALAELDADVRVRALEFLTSAPAAHRVEARSPDLTAIQDALLDSKSGMPVVRLETVLSIDDTAFWLSGWIHDAAPEEADLLFVTPDGVHVQVEPGALSFYPRPDVDDMFDAGPSRGFHAYVELSRPSAATDGWVVRARSAQDRARAPVRRDHASAHGRALHVMRQDSVTDDVVEGQVLPALARIRAATAGRIDAVTEFGTPPERPEFSLVIPLRKMDRVEHQLVQFARDPDFARVELTFVIAPGLVPAFRWRAHDWSDLFRLGFRAAELSADVSRPRAFNLGAAIARAETLVLMQGDVFPAAPGWLGPLGECLHSHREVGAVAPRLLFSDGSVAHAETLYEPAGDGAGWECVLPWRGLSDSLAAAGGARPVQSLSDAFIMLRAEDHRRVGGFSDDYLGGSHEAADLCLRLAAEGLDSWLADVAMYWLERADSWPSAEGPGISRLNAWLFAYRWTERLRAPDTGAAQQADPPVEILDVCCDPDAAIVLPRSRAEVECYAGTYAFPVEGWAPGRNGGPVRIEVRDGSRTLRETTAHVQRHEAGTDGAGFQTAVGTLGLPREFEVEVAAVADGGIRTLLGVVRGRRRSLPPAFAPSIQPLLVTTLGRSGSSWLALLLSEHPEITAYRPFQYEARVATYWTSVLAALADPASYIQALRPEYYAGHWWLGDRRSEPLPFQLAEPHMPAWMGSVGVNALAGFCQSRIEAFYVELTRLQGCPTPRYFAEKSYPDAALGLVAELYPDSREIVLVRDFRDMVCSIIAFNARRGFPSFGRELTDSDEAMIHLLREHALALVTGLRRRRDRALLVRYEDLVVALEPTLAGVFAYLGVDARPRTTQRVIANASAVLPDVQRAHRTSDTVAASVGRWRDELSPASKAACDEAFGDLLPVFGYE